jgi:uroporphyrinogen-III synthase
MRNVGLESRGVVNTRAPHQAEELNALLRTRGAKVLGYPCIDIAPPLDPTALDQALREAAAGRFDWLALTSANTVRSLADRLNALGLALGRASAMRVAAVGPATAEAAGSLLGLEVVAIPDEHVGGALADTILKIAAGTGSRQLSFRVLLPQADLAGPALARKLNEGGATVSAPTAYRTVPGHGGVDLPKLLTEGAVDAIVLASPSAAENLLLRLLNEGGTKEQLAGVRMACIGGVTAGAARQLGLQVHVCPEEHTLPALVQALEDSFRERNEEQ